ncbi:MAG: 1-deoxy-D-xylulose-5-phosphate reductoisomerase [Candidatus Pelagibacter sp.]
MKKKIAILGSTGSIGKSTLSIVNENKNDFDVVLLSTNKNLLELKKQYKKFKPAYLVISNNQSYNEFIRKKNCKAKIFNNYNSLSKILKKKIDYTISAISGFEGLDPTLKIIPHTKTLAIANKESLICAWNLIKKKIDKYKTQFIPIDSEHFSIWSLLKGTTSKVEKIYITASGGPFLNINKKKLKNIKPEHAVKHPKWNMGKKISIDSATLINKVFEAIEAKKIFDIDLNKIEILIHPDSYVHAIVKFKNGITKLLIHDTDMKIPIFNSIYINGGKVFKSRSLDLSKINNFKFKKVNSNHFNSINILKLFRDIKSSLFETVLVSANDELVNQFLKKNISFLDITKKLIMIMNLKEFKKMRLRRPKNFSEISKLNKYVRLKTQSLCVRSL